MKIFCLIFLVQICAFATRPCAEFFPGTASWAPASESVAPVRRDAPVDDRCDECSPLCSCSCCGHSLAAPFFAPATRPVRGVGFYSASTILVPDRYDYANPDSIWQPPKV